MKRFFAIIIVLLTYYHLYGQTDTVYCYTYGGILNDVCNQIEPTYDGGYIMIGTSNSFGCGNTDFYAVKIDSSGKHEWSKSYGGIGNEEGFSVTPTFDKGYAFLGFTDSYGAGGYDVFLVKTDSMGNFQWQRTYGGSDWDFGYSIQQLSDSGFIMCGLTYSYGAGNGDIYVIRTNKNGDTLWTKTVGGSGYDVGNSLCVENDSLYAIIGNTTSFGLGDTNVYFVLMDSKGIVKKSATYGCTQGDIGNSIRETKDRGFVVFGSTDSIPNSTQVGTPGEMIIKTDSIGGLQWMQICYVISKTGIGHDAVQEPDGSYVAVSTDDAYGYGVYAMRTWHFSSGGYYINDASLGGSSNQQGNSVAIAKNGNVIFAGASNSPGFTEGLYDIMTARWMNGDSIHNTRFNDTINFRDTSFCTLGIASQSIFYPKVKVYPNPVSSFATLLVQGDGESSYFFNIYNENGALIIQGAPFQSNSHGQSIGHFEKGNLSAGIYIYEILNQSGIIVATGKFVVE